MLGSCGGDRAGEARTLSPARPAASEYRRFLAILASRAARLGARDSEGAAQEALRRSLEKPVSRIAIDYYFGEGANAGSIAPEWKLEQLLAWLHGVLKNVVREEQNRASARREVPFPRMGADEDVDPADPAAGQLDVLLESELHEIVSDCLPMLDGQHRAALGMRAKGLKYGEIAKRLGVTENTVATWVSRGIRELGERVRMRMSRNLR